MLHTAFILPPSSSDCPFPHEFAFSHSSGVFSGKCYNFGSSCGGDRARAKDHSQNLMWGSTVKVAHVRALQPLIRRSLIKPFSLARSIEGPTVVQSYNVTPSRYRYLMDSQDTHDSLVAIWRFNPLPLVCDLFDVCRKQWFPPSPVVSSPVLHYPSSPAITRRPLLQSSILSS